MNVYRLLISSLIAAITISLAGCADIKALERLAHVVVVGLDEAEDGYLNVTFQIANPQVGSTDIGQSDKEPPDDIITITATDVISASELANTIISRQLNFTHLQTIIISEQLARSEDFHEIFSSQVRIPEFRREMNIIICRERAEQFIHSNKPRLETRPHKYYEFMMEQWHKSGLLPISDLNRYLQRLSGELFLAIYATAERVDSPKEKKEADYTAGEVPSRAADPVQMIGSAVFKFGRMIDTLTGDETRITLLLRSSEQAHAHIDSFRDPLNPEKRIGVRLVRKQNTDIRIDLSGDAPDISVKVPLGVQVLSIQGLGNYITDPKKQQLLVETIEKSLEEDADALIKKSQQKFQSEPFLWNLHVRRKMWTWDDYINYDWNEKFSRARVRVDFDISIDSFGKQLAPTKIHHKR